MLKIPLLDLSMLKKQAADLLAMPLKLCIVLRVRCFLTGVGWHADAGLAAQG